MTIEAAPSLREEALAAVTVPFSFLNAARRLPILSTLKFVGSASSLTTVSPRRDLTVTSAICASGEHSERVLDVEGEVAAGITN